MPKFFNRVKLPVTSTGTGPIDTSVAPETGYQGLTAAGAVSGDSVRYVIEDSNGAWEIGIGVYDVVVEGVSETLSRVVSESSNAGSAINLSGSAYIYLSVAADDLIYSDDPRLTDARAPTAHADPISDVTGLQTELDGKLDLTGGSLSGGLDFGSVVAANRQDISGHIDLYGGTYGISVTAQSINIVSGVDGQTYFTDSGGVAYARVDKDGNATTADTLITRDMGDLRFAPLSHTHVLADITDAGSAAALNVPPGGQNADSTEVVRGDDLRLTNARAPTAHVHGLGDISDWPDLFNNSGLTHNVYNDFNNTTDYGSRFIKGDTNGPGTAGMYYGFILGLGDGYASTAYASQIYWGRNVADPYINIRSLENGTWGAWQKAAAGKADQLKTARTISLSGDVFGSVSFDGTADADITVTIADDSHNHVIANIDGLQTALDGKATAAQGAKADAAIPSTEKGAANGVATLDGSGLVPAAQLPSFVSDVEEYADFASFPATGESGKIYVDLSTEDIYRWGGSAYVQINDAVSSADQATKLATARTITIDGDASGSTSFDGSGDVTITLDISDDSHSHVIANIDGLQTALDGKLSTSGGTVSGVVTAQRFVANLEGTPALTVEAENVETPIFRVNADAPGSTKSNYGFSLTYLGQGSGNENNLVLRSDNQTAADQVDVFTVQQDGNITINSNATFEGTTTHKSTVTISEAAPKLVWDDSDTTGIHQIISSNATLRLEADPGNVDAVSDIQFFVDGTMQGIISSGGTLGFDKSIVTRETGDARYATAAQGSLADSASQPGHTHAISDTTGLQTALDGKADLSGDTFTGEMVFNDALVLSDAGAIEDNVTKLYRNGNFVHHGKRALKGFIPRIVPNIDMDTATGDNKYYELGSFAFSSMQGEMRIDFLFAGSGGGIEATFLLPLTYNMDYLGDYGVSAAADTWYVLTPLHETPRHYLSFATQYELLAKWNGNSIEFRARTVDVTQTGGALTLYAKFQHSDEFENCTYTELTGTGTDATSYTILPQLLGGLRGETRFGNDVRVMEDFFVEGNITVSGTVDGRNVLEDGIALDGKLDKAGGTMTGDLTINSGGNSELLIQGTNAAWVDLNNGGISWNVQAYSDDTFRVTSGGLGGSELVIDNVGNVGIGTTNPTYPLHVVGTGYFTGLQLNSGNEIVFGNPNQKIRGTNDTSIEIVTGGSTSVTINDDGSTSFAGNITTTGTVDGRDVAADGTKLDGIEAGADVTDTTNVTAAGALMDSEVVNLAAVKAFDPADYATAAQGATADAAIPATEKGAVNGVATLDGSGLVPASQLPSFVDDVLEYADFASLPGTGETGKIYVTLDENDQYRWSGSAYVKISDAVSSSDQATKLATARTISLAGAATGSAAFDGSANVSISVSNVNADTLDGIDSTGFVRLNATGNNDGYTYLHRNNNSYPPFYVNQLGTAPIARFLKGATTSDTDSASALDITNEGGIEADGNIVTSGNVGIGTTTPATALHLGPDGAVARIESSTAGRHLEISSANSGLIKQNVGGVDIQGGAGQQIHVGGSEASYFHGQGYDFYFTGGGNVGIGTGTPAELLHVAGNAQVDGELHIEQQADGFGIEIAHTTRSGIHRINHSGVNSENLVFQQSDDAGATFDTHLMVGKDGLEYYDAAGTRTLDLTPSGQLTISGALIATGAIAAAGYNSTSWDTAYSWGDHAAAGYARLDGSTTFTGKIVGTGGAKFTVQNQADGGPDNGIFLWNDTDPNWGLYMGQAGIGKSLAGGTAAQGIDGRTSHHVRIRMANGPTQGFMLENSSEQALLQVTADTGDTHVRGKLTAGNNPANEVFHPGNQPASTDISDFDAAVAAKVQDEAIAMAIALG